MHCIDTPAHLAENKPQNIAESMQIYVLPYPKKRRHSPVRVLLRQALGLTLSELGRIVLPNVGVRTCVARD
jgi:hypothetical protein